MQVFPYCEQELTLQHSLFSHRNHIDKSSKAECQSWCHLLICDTSPQIQCPQMSKYHQNTSCCTNILHKFRKLHKWTTHNELQSEATLQTAGIALSRTPIIASVIFLPLIWACPRRRGKKKDPTISLGLGTDLPNSLKAWCLNYQFEPSSSQCLSPRSAVVRRFGLQSPL